MYLLLDSTDIMPYVKYGGYSVGHKKVLGPNSFTTLDGTYHEDVIAKKTIIQVALKPVTTDELTIVVNACEDISSATYFDTKTNAYKTINVIADVSIASVVINADTVLYWGGSDGIIITLEEM